MNSSTFTLSCARCGKAVTGYSTRDGKGNAYCRACIDRLSGSDAPGRSAAHTCALCGIIFEQQKEAAPRFEGKGHYCPDCLARLHGRRAGRRAPATGRNHDAAFDQMIHEIFENPAPFAMAG